MWSLRTARASSQVQVALASVTHAGVLAVPQQRVAADLLLVQLREAHDGVGAREVVDAGGGMDLGPLHVVLGRDRVELGADQLLVGRRVLAVVVDQVALAPRGGADEGAVRACVSQRRLIRPCCRGGEEQRRGGGEREAAEQWTSDGSHLGNSFVSMRPVFWCVTELNGE